MSIGKRVPREPVGGSASASPSPTARRSARVLRGALGRSLSLVWRAAPRELTATIVTQAVSGALLAVQLLVARLLFGALVEADRVGGPFDSVVPELLGLVGITGAILFLQVVQGERLLLLREVVMRRAQEEVLEVVSRVDLESFEDPSFFDRFERARTEASARSATLANALAGVLSTLFAIVSLGLAIAVVEPLLLPIAAVGAIPVWLATSRNSRLYHQFTYEMTQKNRMRHYVGAVLADEHLAKEVRAFDTAPFLLERYRGLSEEYVAGLRRVVRVRTLRALIAAIVASAVTAVGFGFLVSLLLRDRLAVADLAVGAWGLLALAQRIRGATHSAGSMYEASLFLDDVAKFLDQVPDPKETATGSPQVGAGQLDRLELEDVSFAYPGAASPALQGVSLTLGRGEVVALVGPNGSGKTTLTKLIGQLYRPDTGAIRWNGVDVTKADQAVLRQEISTIFQDFARLYFSAAENIGIGRWPRIDDRDAIVEAARTAGADGFLQHLPSGYETPLNRAFDGGTNLSLGQWQRVALARAYFRHASLVIMDEPTASLDAVAESEFYERVQALCEDRALLLVSHRFSTVRKADRIYVLDEGCIVEQGNHDELIAAEGVYSRLYNIQAAAYTSET